MKTKSERTGSLATAFALLVAVFLLWRLVRTRTRDRHGDNAEASPPLPPVAGGEALFRARNAASRRLQAMVPCARRQISRFEAGNRSAAPRAVSDPSSYRQEVRYALPFTREWFVLKGGVERETSHSWEVLSQRHAYDFVIVDEASRRWRTTGESLEDYYCYGAPVLAPADGVVVVVRDGVRDAPRPGTGWMDVFTPDFGGNHVVIRHAEGEYSFLAHLMPGSVSVGEGERVERGRRVGRCGNSGRSLEPHLHFHVQDRADMFESAGLPVAFDDVSVDGDEPAPGRYLRRGTRVRPG